MSSNDEKVRFEVEMSAEVDRILRSLEDSMHASRGDVLLKAIGLLKFAVDARSRGRKVGSAQTGEQLETEVTGF